MNEKFELAILFVLVVVCATLVYFAVRNQNKPKITQEQIYTKYCNNKHWSSACEELQLTLTKN